MQKYDFLQKSHHSVETALSGGCFPQPSELKIDFFIAQQKKTE